MKNPKDQPRDNCFQTLSGSRMVLPIIIFSKFFPLKKSALKSKTEKIQLITAYGHLNIPIVRACSVRELHHMHSIPTNSSRLDTLQV